MTLVVRILIPAALVPEWIARGYREIYRGPGGWRVPGEAVVMEWRALPQNPAAGPRSEAGDGVLRQPPAGRW